jgi:hypothetical protein
MTGSDRLPLTVPSLVDLVWDLIWLAWDWYIQAAAWLASLEDGGDA